MNITTIGIDLAKTSFSLVGTNKHGKVVLRKTLNRKKLLPFIAQCPPCSTRTVGSLRPGWV